MFNISIVFNYFILLGLLVSSFLVQSILLIRFELPYLKSNQICFSIFLQMLIANIIMMAPQSMKLLFLQTFIVVGFAASDAGVTFQLG